MAGFSIIMVMFLLIMAAFLVMFVFEIMSVLSIVFSAVSLSKSKKYISLGGRCDYRSVKRSHSTAVVFFVIGCIGAAFTGIVILGLTLDFFEEYTRYEDYESLIGGLIFIIVGVGKYIVLLLLGIKSFRMFGRAKALNNTLNVGAAMYYCPQNYYGTYSYNGVFNNQQTGGMESVSAPKKEERAPAEIKEQGAEKGIFGDTIPDKTCSKCGCVNSGLYKYCTMCGEKL